MGQRQSQRVKMVLPIRISGEDANGKAFSHLAHTLDFSRQGARLGGVKVELRVDGEVTVEYKRNRGRFKVRWVDAKRYQVGVESVDSEKFKFMDLPEEKYLDSYEVKGPREWTVEVEPPPGAKPAAASAQSKPAAAVKTPAPADSKPAPVLEVTPAPAESKPAPVLQVTPAPAQPKPVPVLEMAAAPADSEPAASLNIETAQPERSSVPVQAISGSGKLADLKCRLREHKADTDAALQLVTTTACELLPASGAAVALIAGEDWLCRASAGVAPRVGVRFQSPGGLTGAAASSGEIVVCLDTETDSRVNPSIWRSVRLRSAASVPVMAKSNAVGVLEVFADAPNAFGKEQNQMLSEFGDLLAELVSDSTLAAK